MRTVIVSITLTDGSTNEKPARVINARWCAFRAHPRSGWSLTHRATGCSAGKGLKTFAKAQALARSLERAYGVKRWTFTDRKATKGMSKCKPIIARHGAYL